MDIPYCVGVVQTKYVEKKKPAFALLYYISCVVSIDHSRLHGATMLMPLGLLAP